MSIQENFQFDLLVEFFNRGLHSVVEEIIFKLPPRSVLACKEVNKVWNQIFLLYCQSNNSRIKKIKEKQLVEEWRKKGPIIQEISLKSFGIFEVKSFQMVGDDEHLVVAANINKTIKAKIIILDTKTLEVLKVLDIKDSTGIEQDILEIKMSIEKTYLVAYIHARQPSTEGDEHYYSIWKRNEDYSLHPLKLSGKPEMCELLSHRLANVPFLINGSLFIHRETLLNQIEYDEWDLNTHSKKSKTITVPADFLPKNWYTQRDDLSNFAAVKSIIQGKRVIFGKEGFPEHSVIIKDYGTGPYYKPSIVGHNSEFIAVLLKSVHSFIREFQLYHSKSGKKAAQFYGMIDYRGPPLFEEIEVQFSQNHAATW